MVLDSLSQRVAQELQEMQASADWDKLKLVLEETNVGQPFTCTVSSINTSYTFIQNLYNLWRWEGMSGRPISSLKTIVEIGGGFGATALMCQRLGFSGKYVMLDLPEMLIIARYYLSQTIKMDNNTQILFTSKLDDLLKFSNTELVIASNSVSEMNEESRNKIFNCFTNNFHLLARFTHVWEGIDNLTWFSKFGKPIELSRPYYLIAR